MLYIIYKITNQINGKFYIGSHKTKDLNDDYMGSGKYIKHSQQKYGLENFKKEILFIFDNSEDMYAKEAEIVNENFILNENTYNLKIGGFGGWDFVNKNYPKEKRIENGTKSQDYFKLNPEKRPPVPKPTKEQLSKGGKTAIERYGERIRESAQTDTAKQKRLSTMENNKHQQGEKNSHYGTRWIYNLQFKVSKRIMKEDPLPPGWQEGRKMKFS